VLGLLERPWRQGPRGVAFGADHLAWPSCAATGRSRPRALRHSSLNTAPARVGSLRAAGPAYRSAPCSAPGLSARTGRGPEVLRRNCGPRCAGASRTASILGRGRRHRCVRRSGPEPGGHGRMMYAVAARRSAVHAHTQRSPRRRIRCDRRAGALLAQPRRAVAHASAGSHSASGRGQRQHRAGARKTFYLARHVDLPRRAGTNQRRWRGARAATLVGLYERHFDQPPSPHRVSPPALAPTSWQETSAGDRLRGRHARLECLVSCKMPIEASAQASCLLAVARPAKEHRSL